MLLLVLLILKSYLENHILVVRHSNSHSNTKPIKSEVPQGSELSLIL